MPRPIRSPGGAAAAPLPRVLVIVGPTASGKTAVSILVAKILHGEILSADSRQVYRHMDIGTAKPSPRQRKEIRHHFIDDLSPDLPFNAGEFGKRGRALIASILRAKNVPIIVGGSGLYLQALVDGFFEGPSADERIRKQIAGRMNTEGAEALLKELELVDPVAASRMIPANTRRIIRALEVYHLTGTPISRLQQTRVRMAFRPVIAGLRWPREELYERIDRRVDAMVEEGLIDEVRGLLAMGYSPEENALQTVGYRETVQYLRGDISRDRMVELVKRNSRRYAKRQMTWFRRDHRIRWFDVDGERDYPVLAEQICRYFESVS